tara:strand:- start:161 stop:499 length:339 start_codon:yes stop_codon:yes gene_type:complete
MPLYKADGNKQVPGTFKGRNKYSTAETPAADTVVKRCSYVMINQTGSYAFSYDSGSALPGNATHTYVTASVTTGDVSGDITPFKLDVNPIAWRRIDATGAIGEITFVYVRVR